jgi:hypothetical protein
METKNYEGVKEAVVQDLKQKLKKVDCKLKNGVFLPYLHDVKHNEESSASGDAVDAFLRGEKDVYFVRHSFNGVTSHLCSFTGGIVFLYALCCLDAYVSNR